MFGKNLRKSLTPLSHKRKHLDKNLGRQMKSKLKNPVPDYYTTPNFGRAEKFADTEHCLTIKAHLSVFQVSNQCKHA